MEEEGEGRGDGEQNGDDGEVGERDGQEERLASLEERREWHCESFCDVIF